MLYHRKSSFHIANIDKDLFISWLVVGDDKIKPILMTTSIGVDT